jgi:peptide/nickel transport system permease protein
MAARDLEGNAVTGSRTASPTGVSALGGRAVSDAGPAKGALGGALNERGRSPWWWIRTLSPLTWICLGVLAAFVLCGVFADVIAPHDPTANDLRARLQAPVFSADGSAEHLLGTDQLGRDLLSRVIHGARVSLAIGFLGMCIGAVVGVLSGLVAGFVRGLVDEAMMLLVDAVIALPFLIIALSIISVFGTSLVILIVVAALSGWASYTRVARGLVLGAREQQYVLASRALGAAPGRLLFRHILPNIVAPLIVLATFQLTSIILLEASLSFLGFGMQPPTASWGLMVSEGREYLNTAWWIGVFPGLALMCITISVSLAGDWLRDVLDPSLRAR